MIKHGLARAAIVAAFPEFEVDPQRLNVFIDKGRAVGRASVTGVRAALEYRYTCQIVVEAFAGDIDRLMLVLVAFLRANQPDALLNHAAAAQAIGFRAEILDDGSADIAIDLPLTEVIGTDSTGAPMAIPDPAIPGDGPDGFLGAIPAHLRDLTISDIIGA